MTNSVEETGYPEDGALAEIRASFQQGSPGRARADAAAGRTNAYTLQQEEKARLAGVVERQRVEGKILQEQRAEAERVRAVEEIMGRVRAGSLTTREMVALRKLPASEVASYIEQLVAEVRKKDVGTLG